MDQHLTENIPLANLATLSGLAFHHFAHAFKDSMGVSPHRFLIERRVARARLLLADSHLSVAEVALMLGFADQSHFTEHFRRLTGITPARYRRNL
jgi:Transcriptional regulator containing an amidase domain and an AraC-type DNA-binding HTH domain